MGTMSTLAYLAMALTELERISGITKQTLRWSKESSSQPEEIAAGVLFDDVLRLLAGRLQNRNMKLEDIVRGWTKPEHR